jgi:hypothetical protein
MRWWGSKGVLMEQEVDTGGASTPQSMTDLLARIRAEWSALLTVVEGLSAEQMATPDAGGWSPKDNLAHLAAWEQWLLRYHLGGEPAHQVLQLDEATFDTFDETSINALLYERNRDRSVGSILSELKDTNNRVLATLERLSFDDLLAARYADDPQHRPVLDWVIGNTYEHIHEHRQTIERAIHQ